MAIVTNEVIQTLTEDEARKQARVFRALGDATRLKILSLLVRHGDTITVDEMVECVGGGLQQSTISMHLGVLVNADLVLYRKNGLHRYYRLNDDGIRAAQGYIDALAGEVK